jgi:flagellar assembly factor FliW
MWYDTTNFGRLHIDAEGLLVFPDGLIGLESSRHWTLLWDEAEAAVGWLQSLSDPDLALTVVPPQRYVPGYVLRVPRDELAALPWAATDRALVMLVVSKHEGLFTANLQAPVVMNLDRCLGRQVVVADQQPVQFVLPDQSVLARKSA